MATSQPSIQDLLRASNARMGSLGAVLLEDETYWRDRFHFFATRGYTLRQRYRPDWTPSWESDPDETPLVFEDFFQSPFSHLIDATRNSDGRLICIKRVPTNSEELKIAQLFSQLHLHTDSRNHCVPTLDSFADYNDNTVSYMVMPFLRPMNDPPFDLVGDVVDFVDQIIEGLAFMHENCVAHRNCVPSNLVMDAEPLYPRGFHPVILSQTRDLKASAPYYTRANISVPIKYYLADFSLSSRIPAELPRQVTDRTCADNEVRELMDDFRPDPFKTDVFVLGNSLRQILHDKYFRVGFLLPIIISMTEGSPNDRPSAEGILNQWRQIRKRISAFQRACRLRGRDEGIVSALAHDVLSLLGVIFIIMGRLQRWSVEWLWSILWMTSVASLVSTCC